MPSAPCCGTGLLESLVVDRGLAEMLVSVARRTGGERPADTVDIG